MKKQYLPLLVALAVAPTALAQSKFEARSQVIANHYLDMVQQPGTVMAEFSDLPFTAGAVARSGAVSQVLIILNEGTTVEDIESYGLEVQSVIGDVAVAIGNVDDIIALADTDLSIQMSFPKTIEAKLDRARTYSNVDKVQAGTGLSMPYKGKGVITAIYDVGMDPNHVNFKTPDLKESRIENLWNFSLSGIAQYYSKDRISSFTTDDRTQTHGTHTMGCLAGGYTGNGKYYTTSLTGKATLRPNDPIPYYGMAPESEIAAACGFNSSANVLLASQQLSEYIKSSSKPGLLSLSFGSNLGPHDGTDAEGRALNTIGAQIPVYISAGNEGSDNFTFVETFTAAKKQMKTLICPSAKNANGEIEIWTADNRPVTVRLIVYDRQAKKELYSYAIQGEASGTLANGSYSTAGYIKDSNFDLAFRNSTVSFTQKLSATNNRYQTYLKYTLSTATTNNDKRYALGLVIEGEVGQHYDLSTNSGDSMGNNQATLSDWNCPGFESATPDMSISTMACGENVICIGAYNTRKDWTILSGTLYSYQIATYNVGKIAPYSSYGTLYNGKTLPFVCAPGSGIISSVSRFYVTDNNNANELSAEVTDGNQKYYYEVMQGTSMAAPVAAGIGALWLQANPNLTPQDFHYIIKKTSVKDAEVTANPVRFGEGKLDALAGIQEAVKITGVADVKVDAAEAIITLYGRQLQVVVPGVAAVEAAVYDLNGRRVAGNAASGDSAEVDCSALQSGVYVVTVNGTSSHKFVI